MFEHDESRLFLFTNTTCVIIFLQLTFVNLKIFLIKTFNVVNEQRHGKYVCNLNLDRQSKLTQNKYITNDKLYLFVKKHFFIVFNFIYHKIYVACNWFFFKIYLLLMSPAVTLNFDFNIFILIVYQFNCYLYSVPIICLYFCHRITVFFIFILFVLVATVFPQFQLLVYFSHIFCKINNENMKKLLFFPLYSVIICFT